MKKPRVWEDEVDNWDSDSQNVSSSDPLAGSGKSLLNCAAGFKRNIGEPMPANSIQKLWENVFPEKKQNDDNPSDVYQGVGTSETEGDSSLMVLETKKPTWNTTISAWVLNFNGRVRIPSKKNFILIPEQGNMTTESEFTNRDGEITEMVVLRHGKMSKSRFTVDFRYPICPLAALAICCSSFAMKRAVT